jgi:hypothetical protein
MPILRTSEDNGLTWGTSRLVADAMVDYSALVNGELSAVAGPKGQGGVLWGSCTHPVPFRLWCLPVEQVGAESYWTIGFTRFKIKIHKEPAHIQPPTLERDPHGHGSSGHDDLAHSAADASENGSWHQFR